MTERSPAGDDPDPVVRLAAAHADLLDDPRPGARAAVEADDPDAAHVFTALDRTRADLAALGADTGTVPTPPGLADDVRRAVAAESASATPQRPPAPRTPQAPATPATPRSRRRPAVLLAAAAVALLAVVGIVAVTGVTTSGPAPDVAPPVAQGPAHDPAQGPAPPPDRPLVRGDDLPSALRTGLAGGPPSRAEGGLVADPARLTACLGAHGVPATTPPVAARPVLIDGAPGVLLVLPTGVAARFRVLVVGEGCGAGAPLTLADAVVGR